MGIWAIPGAFGRSCPRVLADATLATSANVFYPVRSMRSTVIHENGVVQTGTESNPENGFNGRFETFHAVESPCQEVKNLLISEWGKTLLLKEELRLILVLRLWHTPHLLNTLIPKLFMKLSNTVSKSVFWHGTNSRSVGRIDHSALFRGRSLDQIDGAAKEELKK